MKHDDRAEKLIKAGREARLAGEPITANPLKNFLSDPGLRERHPADKEWRDEMLQDQGPETGND